MEDPNQASGGMQIVADGADPQVAQMVSQMMGIPPEQAANYALVQKSPQPTQQDPAAQAGGGGEPSQEQIIREAIRAQAGQG